MANVLPVFGSDQEVSSMHYNLLLLTVIPTENSRVEVVLDLISLEMMDIV